MNGGTKGSFTGSGVSVVAVRSASPAALAGVIPGARVLTVDGRTIEDSLDFQFEAADETIRVEWVDLRGFRRSARLVRRWGEDFGMTLADLTVRACRNRCVFCFVHQNPRGLRPSLYFKDEDFRLSFLHGHYITLTNLSAADFDRIIRQRLSPLYLSIHATDHALRNRLLGRRDAPDPLSAIARLAEAGILMHFQVVLCPGWNDGPHLRQTVHTLARFHPRGATVAIVPVGVTRYRDRLPAFTSPTPQYARELLEQVRVWQRAFHRRIGSRFCFPSDEWFLLAGRPVPSRAYYEGFPLAENGVGMVRRFQDSWGRLVRRLPDRVDPPRRVGVVTGTLAAPVLKPIVERLVLVPGLAVELAVVPNRFFGGTIGAAGLLTGSDIARTLQTAGRFTAVLIPSVCLKADEAIFLDDLPLRRLEEQLGVPIHAVEPSARCLVKAAVFGQVVSGQPAFSVESHLPQSSCS